MLRFLGGKPGLGLEITSSAIRLALTTGRGRSVSVIATKTAELPHGLVHETYSSPNVRDAVRLGLILKECLSSLRSQGVRRTALSLPDGMFRVQTLEFEQLPAKTADRERLIRWRLEKAAAFDSADTVLRWQVLRRRENGFTALACVAKRAVLAQYEDMLIDAGLEPWSVGLSSLHTLSFYAGLLTKRDPVAALAHVGENSFTTIVSDGGAVRFYRYKELKRGSADEVRTRTVRELEDSLHFYSHMVSSHPVPIKRLYLTGEPASHDDEVQALKADLSLEIEALSPSAVLAPNSVVRPELAAALGAGSSL